jgi:hypothetical protein
MQFFSCVLVAVSATGDCRPSESGDAVSGTTGASPEACDAPSLLQLRHSEPVVDDDNAAGAPLFDITTAGAKFCRIGGVVPYWKVIGEWRNVAIACSPDYGICDEFKAVAEQKCGLTQGHVLRPEAHSTDARRGDGAA